MAIVNAPTGTVTFLFSDIEGSTKLWQNHPVEMAAALKRHDLILRETLQNCGGYVFKTVGDAFCAAFATARDAVKAMRASQTLLGQESWPEPIRLNVRMAVHSGSAEERDGDYFGKPLNRVARLLAVAHGGQCLLSNAAIALLAEDLPAGISLRSLGEHRLKDLELAETVYQLDWEPVPREFPRLLSLDNDTLPNNLPPQPTSFIGRQEELQKVVGLLQQSRHLTLTGSGGCGKTRLALQAAAEMVESAKDGVWFVDLASIHDAGLIPQTVLAALKASANSGLSPVEALIHYLEHKDALIVLDNCEHLVEACATHVSRVLGSCRSVRFLCTSRSPLEVYGEVTYRVPSLKLPEPGADLSHGELGQYAAVRLFIDRAVLHDPEFAVTNENAPTVADICLRLDGIPLAIELAAARVRSFSLEEIRKRLGDSFRILSGSNRSALPRHQTIRSLIDWSYNLLEPAEQRLFTRLACFSGGWTVESAEIVCSDEVIDKSEIFDLLGSLCDKSLVSARKEGGITRFSFLETVRQYASEILVGAPDAAVLGQKHTQFALELLKGCRSKLEEGDAKTWMGRFDAEVDNIRAAIDRCLTDISAGELACSLAFEFGTYCFHKGLLFEGIALCRRAIAHCASKPEAEPRLHTLNILGWLAHITQNTSLAKESWGELSRLAEPDSYFYAAARNGLGLVAEQHDGDLESALDHFEALLIYARKQGSREEIALMNIAHTLSALGRYDEAESRIREGIAISISRSKLEALTTSYYVLGCILELKSEWEASDEALAESIRISRDERFYFRLFSALVRRADVLMSLKRLDDAFELIDEARQMTESGVMPDSLVEFPPVYARVLCARGEVKLALPALRQALDTAESGSDKLNATLSLLECARALNELGEKELSALALGTVKNLVGEASDTHPDTRDRLEEVQSAIASHLDAPTMDAQLAKGAGLTVEEVAALMRAAFDRA